MAERDSYRKPRIRGKPSWKAGGPRYLRAVAILAWALQGILMPWTQTPAYAANPDAVAIGVQAVSTAPPIAIADLLASANPSVPGQVTLSWTAPQAYANMVGVTVQSYSVHYATYSVDSLLGDTTSWWNATMGSSITLKAPAFTPQSPGSLENDTFTLNPGTTYYLGVRSMSPMGVLSSIDSHAALPGQQAFVLTAANLSPPAAFSGTALSSSSIQWTWSAIGVATAYQIYSDPADVLVQTVNAPATSWIETGLTANTPYRRKARATDGVSTTGDSAIAAIYTRAQTPTALAVNTVTAASIDLAWNANNNPSGTSFALERSPDGVSGFTVISTTTATSFNDTGLTLSTTYYYRLRAINGDGIPTAYTGVVSGLTSASTIAPREPNGVLSTVVSNGLQVNLSWTPVTLDTSGNPISVDHYLVYRYDTIGGTGTVVAMVNTPQSSYTAPTGGRTYFYRIQAVSSFGTASQLSDYLDSSTEANRYILAADDPATRLIVPSAAAKYLLAANNAFGEDLDVVIDHQPQDETNLTLRSYKITARKVRSGDLVQGFSFPQNILSVELGLGSALSSAPGIRAPTGTTAGSIAQIVSVYWFNGSNFVAFGSPTLTSNQSLSVTVRNLGTYQIRAITLGVKFRLAQGSPYPRVITPNGSENRRVFWFFENPASDTVTGSIYDIRGAHVRDLQVDSMSPTPNSLVWDGRDSNGAVVPSGVYLYKISTADQTVTGTVVVAR
jgi:hypothetical protein